MEYAGYRLVRGAGCRGGFCGACATVYQIKGDPQLKFDLACQTEVQPDMYLTQIPFFPAQKSIYKINELKPQAEEVHRIYPDIVKCFGCNTCTKACPQELDVMWFMSDAIRGDIPGAADKSFDCIMCGLCAARCPQGLQPYNVAMLCRRLQEVMPSHRSGNRIAEIKSASITRTWRKSSLPQRRVEPRYIGLFEPNYRTSWEFESRVLGKGTDVRYPGT
jgi:succinate dehydrogenase/fumarate reductase-like Fe-S protein